MHTDTENARMMIPAFIGEHRETMRDHLDSSGNSVAL